MPLHLGETGYHMVCLLVPTLQLRHPNIAMVYGVVDEGPHQAIVMQYYKQGTLAQAMRTNWVLNLDEAARLGLAYQVIGVDGWVVKVCHLLCGCQAKHVLRRVEHITVKIGVLVVSLFVCYCFYIYCNCSQGQEANACKLTINKQAHHNYRSPGWLCLRDILYHSGRQASNNPGGNMLLQKFHEYVVSFVLDVFSLSLPVCYCTTQIADGMRFLHERTPHPVIHGDLKTSNLLLGENYQRVFIADFGLACKLNSPSMAMQMGALTASISPPEVLNDPMAPRAASADVYAFSIVLSEMMQVSCCADN
jgi:serine/threonine protein kinase